MRRVIVHIDRVGLTAFDEAEARAVAAALKLDLATSLADAARASAAGWRGIESRQTEATSLRVRPAMLPSQVGRAVNRTLAHAIVEQRTARGRR